MGGYVWNKVQNQEQLRMGGKKGGTKYDRLIQPMTWRA